MIDVLKRLAELDAANPNVVYEEDTTEGGMPSSIARHKQELAYMSDKEFAEKYSSKSDDELMAMAWRHGYGKGSKFYVSKRNRGMALSECGMMGAMPATQPHTPASINMTADSGEELSAMLKDIMTLAGRQQTDAHEPLGGADGVAVVDIEPAGDGMGPPGMDATGSMRTMLDRMNDVEEETVEYDNTPEPETTGYSANVPSGNDLHKEKHQYPAAQRGDNAMAATYESLMAEYKKYISEEQDMEEGKK